MRLFLSLLFCTIAFSQEAIQPIPFSHKRHIALALKCKDCHPNPDPGEAMTLPSAAKCMQCHVSIANDKPAVQRLAEYARNKQDVPWVSIYHLPNWVFWNHRTHLDAHTGCDSCHGDVSSMNVITRVTNASTMGGCVACHQKKEASTGCQTCHEGRHS